MRLFVAVDLDAAARASISAEQERLRLITARASPVRWVKAEHLHMTLVFLGEVEESRVNAVIAAYAEAAPVEPFDLAFSGIGAFPLRGAPRALWIGVVEGERHLQALQQLLADRAQRLRIPLEPRPFSPHLTLGRWKESRPSDRQHFMKDRGGPVVARVRIERATLYRSQLSSAGPSYTPLAHATLAAPR